MIRGNSVPSEQEENKLTGAHETASDLRSFEGHIIVCSRHVSQQHVTWSLSDAYTASQMQ